MSSRLDRLFVLIESGSTPYTRQAAATQLGELQRLHPHELHSLLRRITRLLGSSSWDTRCAAAQAVAAVVTHTPPWNPEPVLEGYEEVPGGAGRAETTLTLDMLDIAQILDTSSCLTASQGNEFDMDEGVGQNTKDSLQRAHQQLKAKLGLPLLDTGDSLVTKEDLIMSHATKEIEDVKPNVANILATSSMSSREANRARRKARLALTKTRSLSLGDQETTESCGVSGEKRIKLEERGEEEENGGAGSEAGEEKSLPDGNEPVPDDDGTWGDATEWPLEGFCDRLCKDLFSPIWEVRHGVATALREVMKVHGRGAGKCFGQTKEQMERSNRAWLEDVSVRLLCVLALDRFGDFVSDQVVAPVRETCAQALGVVMSLLSEESLVSRVVDVLLTLMDQRHWETRHGGLLALKYILAVKQDHVESLLPRCLSHILVALRDPVDDVANIAAATLIPVASLLVSSSVTSQASSVTSQASSVTSQASSVTSQAGSVTSQASSVTSPLESLTSQLWSLLAEQDQLASACNNFMSLLAAIMCHPNSHACTALSEPVMEVLPRLWPYLSHSTSSVRLATLRTMVTLTRAHRTLDCSVPSLLATLKHVFQRSLIEHVVEIQNMVEQVWESILTRVPLNSLLMAVCPQIAYWLCLTMQPVNVPFDSAQLVVIETDAADLDSGTSGLKYYLGGVETVPLATREANATRCRILASRLLGLASNYVIQPMSGVDTGTEGAPCPVECYVNLLLVYVRSKSAMQRLVAGLVIADWNKRRVLRPPHDSLTSALVQCLDENIYYDELGSVYTKLLQDTTDLLSFMKHYDLSFDYEAFNRVLTLDEIEHLVGTLLVATMEEQKRSKTSKCLEKVDERRKTILSSAQSTKKDQFTWQIMVQATLAGALLRLECLPAKINPVIKPLMESIKFESSILLQELAASHLALLIGQCSDRNPCPNNKIVQNLCTFLCCDPEFTPVIEGATKGAGISLLLRSNSEASSSSEPTPPCTPGSNPGGFWTVHDQQLEHAYPKTVRSSTESSGNSQLRGGATGGRGGDEVNNNYTGILTLVKQQQSVESKNKGRGPGRPTLGGAATSSTETLGMVNPSSSSSLDVEVEGQKQMKNQCRGASLALRAIATHFGDSLPDKLPKLWEMVTSPLTTAVNTDSFDPRRLAGDDEGARSLVACLQVFEVLAPSLHPSLLTSFLSLQPHLCALLSHPYRAVRHMASRCLATLAPLAPNAVMSSVIEEVVPLLAASSPDLSRQGAVEALINILDKMGLRAVPYLVLLVVPLLGRVSDQDTWVRLGATSCFATCIHLLPLDSALAPAPSLPPRLLAARETEAQFIGQLFEPGRIPDFILPAEMCLTVTLRGYQQAGVNWLWFLRCYNLHGILCDDMGLGKTLQSICVLAGDLHERRRTGEPCLPSLVVCVPTLTGHWLYEVLKFLPNKFLNPLQYAGPPQERERLRAKMSEHNLVIASYDMVRKDLAVFTEVQWNYCILDEGHVIKNDKAKSTRAIKQLRANHRLILSGTPIQNNVLELWSLFDFLMPGFLGTEKQFASRYARPILMSRDAKCSAKEQEAGVLAMEALHRQVLPLVLRRVKQDVLKDLPPKITQDYYCDLSPLQEALYQDFAKMKNVDLSEEKHNHVFQSLRYLQSVCNHPKLILSPTHAQYDSLVTRAGLNLSDIEHAAKLPALKQLLLDCGIGDAGDAGPLTQHRALIFCQLKAMLDIVENDLLKAEMPGVTYLRLDGSVVTTARHHIVHKFNSDPTIDVLLLTTQVGGLGLNLTGADTVIFVEHDWSPMKDLQAMDRAHRIGQKKVVNVYRLITRNTLEEKIMSLQKFKLFTANTVINGENRNLATMATGKLLDLFSLDSQEAVGQGDDHGNAGLKSLLENLPELWDEREYEEEYDLSSFVQSLAPQK